MGDPADMNMSIAPTFDLDQRFSQPGRRASTRARRREEHALAEALRLGILGFAHSRRWCLQTGEHIADEATPVWPRSFRSSSSAASALAALHDPDLAEAIGRWMLAADHGAMPRDVKVSLLLPAAMRRDAWLTDTVLHAIDRSGRPPDLLELRFTEAALLEGDTESLLCLSALMDAGVEIAVDDWGRRYASLSLLRDVPLTTVRLDPAMTHDVVENGEDAAMAAAVVRTAHAYRLTVVAQGVDYGAQQQALRHFGIDAATGRLDRAGFHTAT